MRWLMIIVVAASAALSGCGYVVYDNQKAFEYRVAHLEPVPLEAMTDGGSPAQRVALNQQTYSKLSGGGVVIDSPSGSKVGVLDGEHGSFTPHRGAGTPLIAAAAGDQRLRVTLPPGTYSAGFFVYNRSDAGGSAVPTMSVTLEDGAGEKPILVPWVDPHDPRPQFVGIVSQRSIIAITWEAPSAGAGSCDTGIAGLTLERPK